MAEGADHLLFLFMLLIPPPLVVRRRRWERSDERRSAWRIVHVVTAFALGHSITLALAGLGLIEAAIATGFGLVHGLAFAALIGELGLDRGALVSP
jgi:hypothetical protein